MQSPKIAGINTLRFLCFLWIFFGHNIPGPSPDDGIVMKAYAYAGSYSNWGVQLFFVVSSFLLTYLGIKEKERSGTFSVAAFLKRRAYRIFPLYYLILFVCFGLLPLLSKILAVHISLPQNKWLYLFFLSNYDDSSHIFALQFLWTLAISEQYYLTWALCLLLVKKSFAIVTIFFLGVYAIIFLLLPLVGLQVPSDPLVYLMNFATGCGLAIYYTRNRPVSRPVFWLACCAFVLGAFFFSNNPYVGKIFFCGCMACFILLVNRACKEDFIQENRLYQVCEQLGKYSYGLYIYSGFIITATILLTRKFSWQVPFLFLLVFQLIILVLIAHFSYHYFELKFLNMGKRYRK